MFQQRTFIVSSYNGPGNVNKEVKTLTASTPHAAARDFANSLEGQLYGPLREEPARSDETGLHAWWSVGWSGSGQRMYVREHIGF